MAMKKKVRVLGADIGNNSSKTSEGVCVPSLVAVGSELEGSSFAFRVKWRGQYYIIGETRNAVRFTDASKILRDEYILSLLVSIALSYDESVIDAIVAVGLPYEQYNSSAQRARYAKRISNFKNETITIYRDKDDMVGIEKTINIHDCKVYAEGDIESMLKNAKMPLTVVDFGGGTLDATIYTTSSGMDIHSGRRITKPTVEGKTNDGLGFDEVLNKLKNALNIEGYKITSDSELISILNEDELCIFGKTIDFKKIKDDIIGAYASQVYSFLHNLNFGKSSKVYFIGGCAEIIKDYICKLKGIPTSFIEVLPDSQFVNAINFEKKCIAELDDTKYILVRDK